MENVLQNSPSVHQDHPVSLESCLAYGHDPRHFVVHKELDREWGTCFTLERVLREDECLNLIRAVHALGYKKAAPAYPPSYRNNSRLVIDDAQLANRLFHRIRRHLPDSIVDANGAQWTLTGLNERFRFCCYQPGEFFKIHRDGVFHRCENQRSRLTFMVYLNSSLEFEGGSTRFFASPDPAGVPLASIQPQTGSLIVFDHSLWHDGERVTRGMKYIMRSDILYELETPEPQETGEPQEVHSGYIWSLVEFADGRIATGGRDKTIRIWRREDSSLACEQVLQGHANSITALVAMNGDELWSGSRDRSIRIWKSQDGGFHCTATFDAHDGAVLCLARLEGGRMASGGADSIIRFWNRAGECVGQIAADPSWVWDLKALNHETLVSASESGALSVWRLADGKRVATVSTSGGPIRSLTLLRDGELVASGSGDGEVRIWQLRRAKDSFLLHLVQQLNGHSADIRALVELPNGWLASGSEDNRILIWDLFTGKVERTFEHNDFVTSLAVTSDGRLMSASYDGEIKVWVWDQELYCK